MQISYLSYRVVKKIKWNNERQTFKARNKTVKAREGLDKAKKLKLRDIWQMLTVKRGERDWDTKMDVNKAEKHKQ